MWSWLQENTAVISMLTSIATAFIWLFYLQVIVSTNARQRKALISINRGSGKSLNANLVLCNLGYETVYVTDVIAEVDAGGDRYAVNITDSEGGQEHNSTDPLAGTLQGPLGNGDCRGLGTIDTLLDRIAAQNDFSADDAAERLSVIVLAGREKLIGVRRHYRLVQEGGQTYLDVDTMNTERISRRQARHYRKKWGYDAPKQYDDVPASLHAVGHQTSAANTTSTPKSL